MTGYGSGEHTEGGISYALEIRSVNHRYLKLSIKLPETLQFLEPDIEKLVRAALSRGSVQVALKTRSADATGAKPINRAAMEHYIRELSAVGMPAGTAATIDLAALASLPGVCEAPEQTEELRESQRTIVLALVKRVIAELQKMRAEEGAALRSHLAECCTLVRKELAKVKGRAPAVIDEYHQRLTQRVAALMQEAKLDLQADALAKEVALYAERSDISEEVTRLSAHLNQFDELVQRKEPVGRTLDFLTQEMLREANTIGSKSNDAEIARSVVEIKGAIDRLKEQVQNVE